MWLLAQVPPAPVAIGFWWSVWAGDQPRVGWRGGTDPFPYAVPWGAPSRAPSLGLTLLPVSPGLPPPRLLPWEIWLCCQSGFLGCAMAAYSALPTGKRVVGCPQPAAPCREAQPAPKLGKVGCCLAPELLQPLGACVPGWGVPFGDAPGGLVWCRGASRGAGGCRADGSALPAGRASLHDKASLRIEQVRSEDQGWYECKVLMLDQQYDTFHNGSWVHLTVNGERGGRPGAAAVPGRASL